MKDNKPLLPPKKVTDAVYNAAVMRAYLMAKADERRIKEADRYNDGLFD